MITFSPIYDTLSKMTGIAKGLLDAHIKVQINDVAIELQGAVIDLQSKVSAVQSEYQEALKAKEDAEKKLVTYERWDQESTRYSLQEIAPGVTAYALNPHCASVEPPHWLCAACYSDRKKSILQRAIQGRDMWECPRHARHQIDADG